MTALAVLRPVPHRAFITDTIVASYGAIQGSASVEVVVPALDHFTFEPIDSPQYVGGPFRVTISARDISGNLLIGLQRTGGPQRQYRQHYAFHYGEFLRWTVDGLRGHQPDIPGRLHLG